MLEVMNPQGLSAPSLFSEGICFSDERQLGLKKKDYMAGCPELSSNYVGYNKHSKGVPASITISYEEIESLEELEAQNIGNLLPDDDDLFSAVTDGFDRITHLSNGDETEELDFFSSVGGFELGEKSFSQGTFSLGTSFGENPIGEHPSRTLIVRNLSNNVEDSELSTIFEQYGDIHTLYTACKHRGFVTVSYYDIRAACNAMKALQSKLFRGQKLDVHFSIPKENPTGNIDHGSLALDVDHGSLAVFNLDPLVSNNELLEIFGAYGEVKEIREIPHWSSHILVEFYDVRAAELALSALSNPQIAGKQIRLEPCEPVGSKSFMQPPSSEMEKIESGNLLNQQNWSTNLCSSFSDNGTILGLPTANGGSVGSLVDHVIYNGVSSCASNSLPSLFRADLGKLEIQSPNFNTHSHPKLNNTFSNILHVGGSPSNVSASFGSRIPEVLNGKQFCRAVPNAQPLETQVFGPAASGNSTPRNNFMWNNSLHHQPHAFPWSNSPSFFNGISAIPTQHLHGAYSAPHIANSVPNHHVGSAPSVNPTLWDRHNFYAGESPDATVFHPGSIGNLRISGNSPHPLDYYLPHFPHPVTNGLDASIPSKGVGLHAHQQRCMNFHSRSNRHHRNEGNLGQIENKKQFELDVEQIIRGEDKRTTLMIKNIPNKYTKKMLLATIDERHKGSYDFIYLPIDFKNKCNVGYAFINMIEPSLIVPFYKTFNGKRWEKFNSEKVASLAYARIQGKAALIAHFQNSSLMNEDKRCRPILFRTDGPNAGDQVPFPVGSNIRPRPGNLRTSCRSDESAQDNVHTSVTNDECSIGDFSPGSTKDSD